jgi:Xaa-Pro aminopeptidase
VTRIERLRERIYDPLLVTNPVNIFYLVGFRSSNAALVLEPDRLRLFTDFRYASAARAVPGVEFVEVQRAVYAGLAERLDGRVAFEAEHLTYASWETLQAGGLELVPQRGLVEELRAVKDDEELDALRRAATISDRAYEAMVDEPFVGRSERELAWRMEQIFRELGGEGLSFELHVASGPEGSLPHGGSSDRLVEARELVTIDAGCVVEGYCSDCTRTFATGAPPEELMRIYSVCLEAQESGLAATRAGANGAAVDRAARDVIEAAGYGEDFGHGLGHGVGLQVHEAPVLRPESPDTLVPGNVVTVEPGIYLEGRAGVRIEDLVVVTNGEPEVLTRFTKELVTVG